MPVVRQHDGSPCFGFLFFGFKGQKKRPVSVRPAGRDMILLDVPVVLDDDLIDVLGRIMQQLSRMLVTTLAIWV